VSFLDDNTLQTAPHGRVPNIEFTNMLLLCKQY